MDAFISILCKIFTTTLTLIVTYRLLGLLESSLEEEPSLRGNSLWPERTIYHRRFTVNCATICDFEQKIEDE